MKYRVLFIYKYYWEYGGVPTETRNFIRCLSHLCSVQVHSMRGPLMTDEGEFSHIPNPYINKRLKAFSLSNQFIRSFDTVILVGYSDLFNVVFALRLKLLGIPYIIIPMCQVNDFLDHKNPFVRGIVPDVRNLESGLLSNKLSHSEKGNFSRLIKEWQRKLYRFTFGKFLLKNSSRIAVFSNYEKDTLIRLKDSKLPPIEIFYFGTDTPSNLSDDSLNFDGVKFVVWSRMDYYFKGLDIILLAVSKVVSLCNYKLNFKFFLAGPDYNGGYQQIKRDIEKYGIQEFVQILQPGDYTPGSVGILASADYSVIMSRWDGPVRSLRESLALGIPIICSPQTNFDSLIARYNIGYLAASTDELAATITKACLPENINQMKDNTNSIKSIMSWEFSVEDFYKRIICKSLHYSKKTI